MISTLACAVAAASCQGAPPAPRAPRPAPVEGASTPPPASSALAPSGNVSFAVAQPPLTLTASDGTGLRLAELRADAIIDGPIAFTELRMTFENPLDRTLEGTFRIALPQNASLGRFAMKIGGEWQEGEVVELEAARRAYEDFLHRKQDPALMEKAAGNEFSARVFPIPARGVKEIVVAYVHEVNDGAYVLPLRGLPELGVLEVKASVIGAKTEAPRLFAQRTTPSADYVVDLKSVSPQAASNAVTGVRSGEHAVLRVRPESTTRPDPITSAVVLVDTSASRTLGFEDELALVDRLAKRLAESKASVTVAAFDQTVAPIFEGQAEGFGARELDKLRERGALGASDIGRAIAWARDQAKKGGAKRVILIGDGVATAGDVDAKKLGAGVAALKDAGVERIDALAVGGIRDDAALTRLVRGQLARDGIVADGASADALRRLGEATRSGIAVKVEGATWAWPAKLDGVQAGDAFSIYAELPADRPLKVSIDGKAAEVIDLRKTDKPLVERSIAQAKVASMLEREATSKDDLKKSIVSLAVQHRIMTPYTAMLVLETEQDYARFHIDRKSLVDVLAIQDGAVKRLHRTSIARAVAQASPDLDGDYDGADAINVNGVAKKQDAPAKPTAGKREEARVRPGP
ncbi:MAG: hypothetical protein KF819_27445, partial [Labilithrix sp.]|nr:hypothetical protein [Labilithrix sp.]